MPTFDRYQWLSFDCYGTLVDWESGISDAAPSLVVSDLAELAAVAVPS